MAGVPFNRRKNMRALGYAMEVSKSTVHRWLQLKEIRRHSNAIKPLLSEEGQAAQRASKNRPAGTMKVKPIPNITREVMLSMLLTKVLPAIKEKWPGSSRNVIIQQDNAKPHVDGSDLQFLQAATEGEWNIKLKFQPLNSPDLNVLDLGFFRAIDSLQDQSGPRSLDDLISAVTTAFEELSHEKLNNVFLTLQGVMSQVLATNGGNQFKIPHIGKTKLARQGTLPQNLGVSIEVFQKAHTLVPSENTNAKHVGERNKNPKIDPERKSLATGKSLAKK
ncbi:unnamed protein product [Cuscuta campestris]|uniref:Uncharacterized protein n=1 Tax=Cuscuta campestris TaxID=132261 RepID=A0A484LEG5_9ASTE|nr:unnamed protein product [Cuscuta campestris]